MNCFRYEIDKTADKINSLRDSGDLCFALLGDSHLSEEGDDTCADIRAVDDGVGFDFIVHLGNLTNGDNPQAVSEYLLGAELEKYRSAVGAKKLLVAQGDTDGWRNERYAGQLAQHIMTDEVWHRATGFIDKYDGVSRYKNKPYFYVDCGQDVRLIFLCSYNYQIDEAAEVFEKYVRIDAEQQKWLITEALCGTEDKTVLIFSHRIPHSRFESGADPYAYEGRFTEPVTAIIQSAQRRGTKIAGWIGAGYGYDAEIRICCINFAVIAAQLPKCTKNVPEWARNPGKREIGKPSQDLWDAVILKTKQRQVHFVRFGAGEDRVLEY